MYRDLNDYEMLYMIGENSDDVYKLLYCKYKPLIYKISKKYVLVFKKFGYELDDILQIGYLSLYRASCLYDDSNALFYTYFKTVFHHAIINEIRSNSTMKKEVLNNALSYDAPIDNTDISYIDLFGDIQEDNSVYYEFFISFKNTLPFLESCVFEMFMNGFNIKEICLLLDQKKSIIQEAFIRIRRQSLTYKDLFFFKYVLY